MQIITFETHQMNGISYLDPNPQGSPAVLLLHGLGALGSSWGYQILTLKEHGFRPIAPDLPGFGQSHFTGRSWTLPQAARQVCALLPALDLQHAVVAGISMGGVVAQQIALDSPALVERLVLVNTFAALRPKRWNEAAYLLGRFLRARVAGVNAQAEMVAWRIFPHPLQTELRAELIRQIRQADPKVYPAAMRALALHDSRRRLGQIRVPTLIITGANDTTVPLPNQADLVRGIPTARQVIIPDAGHAVIVDQPQAFNQALLDFLQSSMPL